VFGLIELGQSLGTSIWGIQCQSYDTQLYLLKKSEKIRCATFKIISLLDESLVFFVLVKERKTRAIEGKSRKEGGEKLNELSEFEFSF
jgi:hypothetical protein